MTSYRSRRGNALLCISAFVLLTACGGGGGGGGTSSPTTPPVSVTPTPTPTPTAVSDGVFETTAKTHRFLARATFGPIEADVTALEGKSGSDWFQAELIKPASLTLPFVQTFRASSRGLNEDGEQSFEATQSSRFAFWNNAMNADDQLRQRMAYALSQIFVVSNFASDQLFGLPQTMAAYQDILTRNAFGNYRDLLEEITYSVAMGEFLTYIQNQKGDPDSGRMPDENYAREILQLFSIGLVELNLDGSPKLDSAGNEIETYSNSDITGLARVFTGLSLDHDDFWFEERPDPEAFYSPMIAFPDYHSDLEKSFLGTTIPAGTGAAESIDLALDAIFNHPNVAPFIGRQLIQRLVTSHPSEDYIERVSMAFESGSYTLPDGDLVGTGNRGDLTATLAAVLMDSEALGDQSLADPNFGKVREPVIRIAQWARLFGTRPLQTEWSYPLWWTHPSTALAQSPYGAPSVFNFYRPGYVAPGTESGAAGLTVPELQLVNAGSIPGYANFLSYFVFGWSSGEEDANFRTFLPDYTDEIALADDPTALLDHLDTLITGNQMSAETKANIAEFISFFGISASDDPEENNTLFRVELAILMVMTSPDYLVQK